MTDQTARIEQALVSSDLAEVRGDLAHLSAEQADVLTKARLRLAQGDATADHIVACILDRTVRMPVYRWDDAQRAFAKLASKAQARSLPIPTIEEVSREMVGEDDLAEEWVTARILGAAPVLDGWRCVATLTQVTSDELIRRAMHAQRDVCVGSLLTLVGRIVAESADAWTFEHVASGTRFEVTTDELVAHNHGEFAPRIITHIAHGEQVDTDAFEDLRCDHCGHNRRRHLVFVLRHEDGRELCVGSTCLNDYLGTDALGAWFVWSRLHELGERLDSWSTWSIADHADWLANNPEAITRKAAPAVVAIPAVDFLAACVAETACNGYVSKSAAWKHNRELECDDAHLTPTGLKVFHAYQTGEHVAPTPADFERAGQIVEWIATLDRDQLDRDYELTYTASLAGYYDRVRTSGVHERDASMLASAVTAFARELERRRSDAEWIDAHVPGKVGDGVVLTLVVRRSLGWAVACADEQGRQVLVRKHDYKSGGAIEIGDTIRVSGSIGGLTTYRGVKQTFISRPSVYRPDESLSAALRKKARTMFDRLGEPVPEWAQAAKRSKR